MQGHALGRAQQKRVPANRKSRYRVVIGEDRPPRSSTARNARFWKKNDKTTVTNGQLDKLMKSMFQQPIQKKTGQHALLFPLLNATRNLIVDSVITMTEFLRNRNEAVLSEIKLGSSRKVRHTRRPS